MDSGNSYSLGYRNCFDMEKTKDKYLTVTAKRLKEDLSPIPGLVIESARGKGYSLKIVSGE